MNYRELASAVSRSYDTVRQWRYEITKITGYKFTQVSVRNRRGKGKHLVYNFDKEDLEQFKYLAESLNKGTNKREAILKAFGIPELTFQEKTTRLLTDVYQRIEKLENEKTNLKSELNTLKEKISALTERVEALENKGFLNKFRK